MVEWKEEEESKQQAAARNQSFFVVRAKTNLQYKCVKWKRRMPKNILSDAEIELTVYNLSLIHI